jgi:clan AA aspartic protease
LNNLFGLETDRTIRYSLSVTFGKEAVMGMINVDIELSNPRQPDLSPLSVQALVDTGAMTICIPEHMAVQLDLTEIEKREVTTADEKSHVVPYVGPVQIRFGKRTCFTGALVIGESVLLGAVPMEDMDLVVEPSRRTVTVNPKSPNIPSAVVK